MRSCSPRRKQACDFQSRLGILKRARALIVILTATIAFSQCAERNEKLFVPVSSATSGVKFVNTVISTDSLSVLDFEYMYNGSGVAVGDINNDGLPDIYFTGNMTSSRLYLNKGKMSFEDITEAAKVETSTWANGVVMVDINQDGFKDIYVSVGGSRNTPEKDLANLLFINNGDLTFTESAAAYGLADSGYDIQSAFFDYDHDGDLDMYLLRNAFVSYSRNKSKPKLVNGEALSTDRLYRNNGDLTFTDVSRDAGILIEGFGLGVAITDINEDGWPDVYVSNDFITNDLLYINNRDGTFNNRISQFIKHQTFNGMGVDIADYNNDGEVDIIVLDMLPEDNKRKKLTPRGFGYDEFQNGLGLGYEPQYVRNTLQLNNGNGTFSEIGQLAGIEATEWSWSALFADYDNDGLKDLFITNGYPKDITNLDFIVYGDETQTMGLPTAGRKERLALLNELPGIKIHNYLFKNRGDLTFGNASAAWGMTTPTYSNGAAYADLDNDGDLDLVVNNINDEASVLESRLRQGRNKDVSHYLRIAFSGPAGNREGFGTSVCVTAAGSKQYQYFSPFRGYLSSVEPVLHFGLGAASHADSIEVIWPDGKYQVIGGVPADTVLHVSYENAAQRPVPGHEIAFIQVFRDVTAAVGVDYMHHENAFVDFKVQPLLPHMHSRIGPGIAVGDVNGDGREDFYVGAGSGFRGALFLLQPDGKFVRGNITALDSLTEDMGVLFFDADNDGDADLYVVSGGSKQKKGSEVYQDHLYVNDGHGMFRLAAGALPDLHVSGSCVVGADYDKDGDLDLFVGGRVSPGEYPLPAGSYLLRNESNPGAPLFKNVTVENAEGLSGLGMTCSALWSDYDNDGWVDLIAGGEYMPLTFLHNEQGKLVDATGQTGLEHNSGWWNSLVAGDFDKDGDIDYVVGNRGLNSQYRASEQEPVCVYARDFDKDGRVDPVMSYYVQGTKYVAHSREDMVSQMVSFRGRFRTYSAYANAKFEESLLPEELEDAYVVCAERFATSYVENLGGGRFRISALPLAAQFAPVFGMATGDYDGDGNLDVLLAGNSYSTEVTAGRYDASIGLLLRGDGYGNFLPADPRKSGLKADGDAKGMASLALPDGQLLILVANNSGPLQVYAENQKEKYYRAAPDDSYAVVTLPDGKKYRQEFYYGSTYLSQSSRVLKIEPGAVSLHVVDFKGNSKAIDLSLMSAK